jgi:accessory gene regulator B
MIRRVTVKLSEYLGNNGFIEREEEDVYQYGIEILIATIINFILILALGLLFHRFFHTVVFLVSYCSIRQIAGGYHAKSHSQCIVTFFLGYLSLLLFLKWNPVEKINILIIVGWIASFLLIYFLAPIEDKNHPLERDECIILAKKSKILMIINSVLLIILYFTIPGVSAFIVFGIFGLITIGLVLLAGFIKNFYQK